MFCAGDADCGGDGELNVEVMFVVVVLGGDAAAATAALLFAYKLNFVLSKLFLEILLLLNFSLCIRFTDES